MAQMEKLQAEVTELAYQMRRSMKPWGEVGFLCCSSPETSCKPWVHSTLLCKSGGSLSGAATACSEHGSPHCKGLWGPWLAGCGARGRFASLELVRRAAKCPTEPTPRRIRWIRSVSYPRRHLIPCENNSAFPLAEVFVWQAVRAKQRLTHGGLFRENGSR